MAFFSLSIKEKLKWCNPVYQMV